MKRRLARAISFSRTRLPPPPLIRLSVSRSISSAPSIARSIDRPSNGTKGMPCWRARPAVRSDVGTPDTFRPPAIRAANAASANSAVVPLPSPTVIPSAIMATARSAAVRLKPSMVAGDSDTGSAAAAAPDRHAGTRQFAVKPASQPKAEHAQIANQRPQRMRKGGRPVAFIGCVREPRRTVAGEQRSSEKPQAAGYEQAGETGDRDAGAKKMPKPGFGAAMRPQVMRPELRIVVETAGVPSLRPGCVTGHGSQPTIENQLGAPPVQIIA